MTANSKYIEITPEILSRLRTLQEDSGVSPRKSLRGRKDRPKGLNAAQISGWIKGKAKSASKFRIDYVLHIWEKEEKIEGARKINISKSTSAKSIFSSILVSSLNRDNSN